MENKFGNWKRESKPHKCFDWTKGQGKVWRWSTRAYTFQKLCWDPWKRLFIGSFWTVLKWIPGPHHDRLPVKGWVVASELWRCAELGFSRARRWSPSTKSGAKRGGWARLSTNYSLKEAIPLIRLCVTGEMSREHRTVLLLVLTTCVASLVVGKWSRLFSWTQFC